MKTLVALVVVLGLLSTAGAQQACRPDGLPDMTGLIGSTVGALVGSTIGDGRGQTLAAGVGALVGGAIGEALSPRRPALPGNALIKQLHDHRNRVVEAAVNGTIPMPREATPVRRRGPVLGQCHEIEPGTFACQDQTGSWRILR